MTIDHEAAKRLATEGADDRCQTIGVDRQRLLAQAYLDLAAQLETQKRWIDDLQSGMYVNCIYCGHRYGPNETTPVSMADALKAHVESCPQHPMSALKRELEAAKKDAERLRAIEAAWDQYRARRRSGDPKDFDGRGYIGIDWSPVRLSTLRAIDVAMKKEGA